MDAYSSGDSSKPHSPHRAFILNELKEAKCSLALKDEAMKKLEERLQRVELKQDRSSNSIHGSHHSHRHSSRGSSNAHDHEEDHRRRRNHHHHHGDRHHCEEGHHHAAKSYLPFVKVTSFSGDGDPNVYLDWEAKCEQIFYVHEVKDDRKVKIASLEFLDYAMQWWHRLVMDIGLNKIPPVVSWNNLKWCMRIRFVPPHFRKDLLLKLQRFHQGTLCVDAYFKELETLLIKVDMHESEEAKMDRFVSGLRRDIQDVVELLEYSSLGNLVHLAIKVETQLAKKNAFKNSHNDGYYNNSWKNKNKSFSKYPPKESSFQTRDSKPSTSKSPIKSSCKKCFKCLGYGHIASNCPFKRNMFIHDGIVVSEHDSETSRHSSPSRSPSEIESESPCEGDLLIIRRMLGTIPKPLVDTQRENIFHTRCLITNKLCSLIIDGGSCTNVASTRVVEKLALPTISHTKPYKLQWLSVEGEIIVNKQVLINFAIGMYKDEVLCDIVPMEATHVLLGRPWQYDRHVLHDGLSNTMSFSF